MRRLLVTLTGIVVALAIYFGINDYLKPQKESKHPASASTPSTIDSKAISVVRNSTSANTRRARISATEANAPAMAQDAADDMEKPLISEEFAKAGVKKVVIDSVSNTLRAQGAHEAAALSTAQCVPLPNGTKSENVDAAYYKNWAKEYSCLIP